MVNTPTPVTISTYLAISDATDCRIAAMSPVQLAYNSREKLATSHSLGCVSSATPQPPPVAEMAPRGPIRSLKQYIRHFCSPAVGTIGADVSPITHRRGPGGSSGAWEVVWRIWGHCVVDRWCGALYLIPRFGFVGLYTYSPVSSECGERVAVAIWGTGNR